MKTFLMSKTVLKIMNQDINTVPNNPDAALYKGKRRSTSSNSESLNLMLSKGNNFLTRQSVKFNLEMLKLNENKMKYNAKEVIEDYNLNFTRAIFYVESEEKKQLAKFEENRKKKFARSPIVKFL
jgi:hypothetical protein